MYLYTHIIGDFFLPTIDVPGIGQVFADGFAEEQTMQRILAVLASADNMNSADAQQRLKQASDSAAQSTTAFATSQIRAGNDIKDSADSSSKSLLGLSASSTAYSRVLQNSQRSLTRIFSGTGSGNPFAIGTALFQGLGKLGEGVSDIVGKIPGLGTVLKVGGGLIAQGLSAAGGFLMTKLQETDQAFSDLQAGGGLLAGSFMALRETAHASGLTVKQFTNVVKNNIEELGSFGGATRRGAREFARATGRVRSEFGTQLMQLGLNFEDMGSATANLLQQFALSGVAIETAGIDTKSFATAVRNAVIQQKALSVLTGRTIEQQKSAERQLRRDAQVQAALGNLSGDARNALQQLIAAQPQFRDVILDQITFGRVQSKNAGMLMGILPETVRAVQSTVDSVLTGTEKAPMEFFKILTENSDAIARETEVARNLTNLSRFVNNDFVNLAKGTFTQQQDLVTAAINKTINNLSDDLTSLTKGLDPLTNNVLDLKNKTQDLTIQFGRSISGFLTATQGAPEIIGGFISSLESGLKAINNFFGIPPGTTIGDGSDVTYGQVTPRTFQLTNTDPTGNPTGTPDANTTNTNNNATTNTGVVTNSPKPDGTTTRPLIVNDPNNTAAINALTKQLTRNTQTLDGLSKHLT